MITNITPREQALQRDNERLTAAITAQSAAWEQERNACDELAKRVAGLREELAALKAQLAQPDPRHTSIECADFADRLDEGPQPVLYSDSINGCMVRRDDVWVALTSHLKLYAATGRSIK